jgi:hypothetical protein
MDDDSSAELLKSIIERYLSSGDFHGLPVPEAGSAVHTVKHLLEQRLIEVVGEEDFPNPHIRLWATQRSIDEQLAMAEAAVSGDHPSACLYPTSLALGGNEAVTALADRPYTQRLGAGAGQLDIAYFRTDALEAYRNDPRFSFAFNDFGARAAVTDAVYDDAAEPEADKVSVSLGFAYKQPLDEGPIVRYVCAFLRDLARLSPEHQRRWETWEVHDAEAKPHPIWLAEAMGHWIDRIGPFDALQLELKSWNELHERAFGVPLLRSTTRPRELGWLLRPSQLEWDHFVQLLDKLVSDNLKHDAFDAAGVPAEDEHGTRLGTLSRLDLMLARAHTPEENRRDILQPLRDLRKARSKPSHALRQNVNSEDFIRRQAELLSEVTASLHALRNFWQKHPKNHDWVEPPDAEHRLWL